MVAVRVSFSSLERLIQPPVLVVTGIETTSESGLVLESIPGAIEVVFI